MFNTFNMTLAEYVAHIAENYGNIAYYGRLGSRLNIDVLVWIYSNYVNSENESIADLTDDEQIMFALFICEAEGIDWENA